MATYLSGHFTLEEATYSESAIRRGLKNQPDVNSWSNMQQAAFFLEKVRNVTGPLKVNSWYRTYELNKVVGGANNSAHMSGWAIDVSSDVHSPYELCSLAMESGVMFDQIILEYDRWMHISFDPQSRRQVLSCFKAGCYEMGLTKH
jgi:zinc D-Ala-D-Ala carboxypeptidase